MLSARIRSISTPQTGLSRGFRDQYFHPGLSQCPDIVLRCGTVGDEDVDVRYRSDESERLLPELAVVGKRDANFSRRRNHLLDLCFGVIRSRYAILRINGADAQHSFINTYFGQRTLC